MAVFQMSSGAVSTWSMESSMLDVNELRRKQGYEALALSRKQRRPLGVIRATHHWFGYYRLCFCGCFVVGREQLSLITDALD
jgi:hypothetical protein